MLSAFARAFSNQLIMAPIRDAAHEVAKEYVLEGMQQFFTRWGDHVYEEGMQIKDQKKLENYANEKKDEIEAIRRQAKIQKMYKDVQIPLK